MDLLSIGTIIEINDTKLIIVGYRENQTEKFNFYYIVGLFPLGFTGNKNSLSLLPIDADFSIVSFGYKDDAGEKFLEKKTEAVCMLKNIAPKKVEEVLDLILDKVGREINE